MTLPYTARILGFLLILFSFAQLIPVGIAYIFEENLEIKGFLYAFSFSITLGSILLFYLKIMQKN